MQKYRIRMTKNIRDYLVVLAKHRVHDPDTKAVLDAANKAGDAALRAFMKKAWPARDMKVLEKYGMISTYAQIYVQLVGKSGEPRYTSWRFSRDKLPKPPMNYGQLKVDDQRVVRAIDDAESAAAAHEKARASKLATFEQLIFNARYLEQIEEVWPAAKEARKLVQQLPAVQLAPLMDQVRAIVEAKQA